MTLCEFLERYVYVRKCVCCNERMGYEYREEAFCDSCRISFERAKAEGCPECLRPIADCRCIPSILSKAGVREYRKLVAYKPSERSTPENKLIYFLKNRRSKRVAYFTALQLSYRVEEMLAANEERKADVLITYLPRSKRSYAENGVDQARLVAEALSDVLGIECLPLIKRVRDGKREQKKLTARQRLKNTEGMFAIDTKRLCDCESRSVIIFDDIVTTGASVCRAAQLLSRVGVERIYALSIATAIKEKM